MYVSSRVDASAVLVTSEMGKVKLSTVDQLSISTACGTLYHLGHLSCHGIIIWEPSPAQGRGHTTALSVLLHLWANGMLRAVKATDSFNM